MEGVPEAVDVPRPLVDDAVGRATGNGIAFFIVSRNGTPWPVWNSLAGRETSTEMVILAHRSGRRSEMAAVGRCGLLVG